MSVEAGQEQTQDPSGTGPANTPEGGEQQQSQDPPYAQFLAELPDDVRPLVEPKFKEWDADVTKRFQTLHSEYEPWKQVIDQYDPDTVQGALQLGVVLEQDPTRFLKAFAEAYPDLVKEALGTVEPAPPVNTPEQGQDDLDPNDPLVKRIAQLEQMLEGVTGTLTQQQQSEQASQNQKILEDTLTELHKKHGDFDDTYVLSQIAYAGATPEEAIKAWNNNVVAKFGQQVQQPNGGAPTVVNAGGGLPAEPVDVGKLGSDATVDLVAQMLQQANEG